MMMPMITISKTMAMAMASDNDNYDDDTKYDDDDDEDLSSACYCFPPRPLLGDREWNMGQTWHLDIVPHQGLFSEQCSHITPQKRKYGTDMY